MPVLLDPVASDRAELLLTRGIARIFQGPRDDAVGDLETARKTARRARASNDDRVESAVVRDSRRIRNFLGDGAAHDCVTDGKSEQSLPPGVAGYETVHDEYLWLVCFCDRR